MSDDNYENFVKEMIALAEDGNDVFAKRVLLWFREDFKNFREIDAQILAYLDRCFKKILEGSEPDTALNLRRQANRSKDVWRDLNIVSEVRDIRATGETLKAAQAIVAEKYKLTHDAVRSIVKKNRDFNFQNDGLKFHELTPSGSTSDQELLATLSRNLDNAAQEVKK